MSLDKVYQAVVGMDQAGVVPLVQAELDGGTPVQEILQNGLIAAMDEVGARFSKGEMFVPEMLMAAQVMKAGLELLKPLLTEGEAASEGTVIIGTVKGDLHDIGKNLVAMMLEGAGFEVIDLGVDVDSQAFVNAAKEHAAQVVGLSALLTTTMPAMQETVESLKESGMPVRVMVGGAPVTQEFADKIGAHGYGSDAPSAVNRVRSLMAG